jgi:hypothetical protein
VSVTGLVNPLLKNFCVVVVVVEQVVVEVVEEVAVLCIVVNLAPKTLR